MITHRLLFVLPLLLSLLVGPAAEGAPTDTPNDMRILVFTKTEGYRHESIPDGVDAVRELGLEYGFNVHHSEDATIFTDETLAAYRVIVFLSTSGTLFDEQQKAAFQRFVQSGGGFVGIHAATDTEYDWPWYGQLVGAYFDSHPEIQHAEIDVVDRDHRSTRHLPERWERRDEWYNFQGVPEGVNVLALLDETSYEGGSMGDDHPIAWYHHFDGGRSWYTAGGHTSESFDEALFREHILGGILWAAGE